MEFGGVAEHGKEEEAVGVGVRGDGESRSGAAGARARHVRASGGRNVPGLNGMGRTNRRGAEGRPVLDVVPGRRRNGDADLVRDLDELQVSPTSGTPQDNDRRIQGVAEEA